MCVVVLEQQCSSHTPATTTRPRKTVMLLLCVRWMRSKRDSVVGPTAHSRETITGTKGDGCTDRRRFGAVSSVSRTSGLRFFTLPGTSRAYRLGIRLLFVSLSLLSKIKTNTTTFVERLRNKTLPQQRRRLQLLES